MLLHLCFRLVLNSLQVLEHKYLSYQQKTCKIFQYLQQHLQSFGTTEPKFLQPV
jgi:hypothetical protein